MKNISSADPLGAATKHTVRVPTKSDWEKAAARKYIHTLLTHTTLMPFRWKGNKYTCFYCCQTFYEASKLQYHTREIHKNVVVMKYLSRNVDLASPIKIDVSLTNCLKCTQRLGNLEELLKHLLKHKLICDLDQQYFIPFHLGDSVLPCLKCNESFQFFGKLYSHINKIHLEGTKRICESCGQNFFSDFSLRKHAKIYHLENEFTCRHCVETFTVESKRISHEFKQHNVKTFKCYKCQEHFGSQYLRKLHLSTIHSTTKFGCNDCSKSFVDKCLLSKHYRRVHLKGSEGAGDQIVDQYDSVLIMQS